MPPNISRKMMGRELNFQFSIVFFGLLITTAQLNCEHKAMSQLFTQNVKTFAPLTALMTIERL
jgi:hypothetical protein